MSNSDLSSNASAVPAGKKLKFGILENFFVESTSEFQTSVFFLLVNENIKEGDSHFLI